MKLSALVFMIFLVPAVVPAQESAEQLLLDHYENEDYMLVIEKADSILKADKEVNKARISHIKADAYYFLNDVEKSLQYYLEALDLSEQYPLSTTYRLECYSHTGFCYKYLGQYIEAIPYYEIAYEIASSVSDSIEIANQASNLGTLYSKLGNYEKASIYLNKAYQIDFALKDTTALAYDLVYLGELKLSLGDTEAAISYLKEGLKVKKTIAGDHTTHIQRLGKLSQAYLAAGKLDSAMLYSNSAIESALEIGDSLSLNKQFITEAGIYNAKSNFLSALKSANKAYTYFNKEDNSYQVTSAFELATAYIGRKQFTKAKNLLSEVLAISLENNLLEQSSLIYEKRADLNDLMGNKAAALKDFKNFQAVKDTLQLLDKQNAILVLDQEYQTSQKQQQIELLKAQEKLTRSELAQKRRDILILSILLILLIAVSIFVYTSIRKKNELKNSLLTSQINELRLHIKAVMEGSPEDMKLEIEALNSAIQEPLSEREFEILNFAISDLSNTEIAEKTFVSVNTVKYHLKNVYAKLGVSNRREALKVALQNASS